MIKIRVCRLFGVKSHWIHTVVVVGDDKDLIHKVQDPFFLDKIAQTYKDISSSIQRFGPWSGAWVGEAGGAYNSGGKHVSHYFANGFW